MRMKIQFEALSAFAFLVRVVCGFVEFNDALAQPFQDRKLPAFEKVPRHTRCVLGPYGASDKSFGDVNAPPYLTRCTTDPHGPASPHVGSTQRPSLSKNNLYAAKAPYKPELSQSPDFARRPSLTFFTEKHTPPYFKGKPGESQTAQTTFDFRSADVNQPGPHLLFNQFHPSQRTKEYWLSVDESEYFPPVNRNQDFLSKNMVSEPAIKSDHPSRRHKFARSISQNEIPNHSLRPSLYKQHEKITRKEELHSSEGNTSPFSFPSPSFLEYPSLPFFSEEDEEEDEEEEEEEEEEYPYFPQNTSPFFPQEREPSSFHQYTSPSFFPEEQRFHQYTSPTFFPQSQEYTWPPFFPQEREPSSFHQHTSPSFFPEEQRFHQFTSPTFFPQPQEYNSPPFFPQEPRTGFLQYHYSRHSRPATPSFFKPDEFPFAKYLPFEHEPFGRRSWTGPEPND